MKLYERKSYRVRVWQIPLWGQAAAETPPDWMVQSMQEGRLRVNSRGGMSYDSENRGTLHSIPGDWVIYDGHEIDFCDRESFIEFYAEVQEAA